jgi:putative ABC transport system substrate-binding protein
MKETFSIRALDSQSANRKSKIKNLKWAGLLVILLSLVGHVGLVEAQQPGKIYRLGYLSPRSTTESQEEIFRQALRELGYIEGQNIAIEWRFAGGKLDRLPGLAGDLAQLKVEVIVVRGATATRSVKNVTKTTPIVMTNVTDPVGLGLVANLARPGGNITGLTNLAPELGGKRLELLKEIVPKLSRVAVLADPNTQAYGPQMKEIEVAAPALALQLQHVEVRGPNDLENAFAAMTKGRAGALILLGQPTLTILRERIVKLAANRRLPAMYADPEFVEAGGLMYYGASTTDLFRRAAIYVDKILKGTKPADLPVEQPTKFEFIINLKTAKQIGLTIPPNVLARADKVIR